MEIKVRAAEPKDVEALSRIWDAPRVIAGTLQLPFTGIEHHRRRMDPRPGSRTLLAEVDGEVVGTIVFGVNGSPRRSHVGEFYMGVRDDWQAKGVGTALVKAVVELSDDWLNLKRLELQVYTDNAAAIALYKKFGFEIEGTLRQYAYREGNYVDAYAMARMRQA
jgi:putative acetyltransferase